MMFLRTSTVLLVFLVLGCSSKGVKNNLLTSNIIPECDGSQTMVQLFEWRWEDVANECENFLGPVGYCAVQVSPPQEHREIEGQPWYERYQPVSYKLDSRSGNQEEFEDMVHRCNAAGIRVVVDAVINHMTEQHTEGFGSAGSFYVADNYDFIPYPSEEYFSPAYMCPNKDGVVSAYDNVDEIRNCRLNGLLDLNTMKEKVQEIIAGYLNKLIDIGVAGFRIDSASYMWPEDLEEIFAKVQDLNENEGFQTGTRPFVFTDVISTGTAVKSEEYYSLGSVEEKLYGKRIANRLKDFSLLENMFDSPLGMVPPEKAIVYIDSHHSQREENYAPGEFSSQESRRLNLMATALMLADDYGIARVMSSFEFSEVNQGPPLDQDNMTLPITFSDEGACKGRWVCEHRWKPIANMVKFRYAVAGSNSQAEILQSGALMLSRGNGGLFVMHPQGKMDEVINTGLPEGQYCDIVSDCSNTVNIKADGSAHISINNRELPFAAYCVECEVYSTTELTTEDTTTDEYKSEDSSTYSPITEDPITDISTTEDPITDISTTEDPITDISTTEDPITDISTTEDPITDISTTEDPITDISTTKDPITDMPTTGVSPTESPFKRTVIFMRKHVYNEEYVFIRGGIEESDHPECGPPAETDNCALPIVTQSLGSTPHYDQYDAWRDGDDFLDWFGAEVDQGRYGSTPASGSPTAWTTDMPGVDGYQELNSYGDDYWMIDFYMDCSTIPDNWFEIKGWLEFAGAYTGWEQNINQQTCSGGEGGSAPMPSANHQGKCGFINVFTWNEGPCIIDPFPEIESTTEELTTDMSTTEELTTDMLTTDESTTEGLTTEESTTDESTTDMLSTEESTIDMSTSEEPFTYLSTTESPFKRTVIFIKKHAYDEQYVFIRGGIEEEDHPECGPPAESDLCALPIVTQSLGSTYNYDKYDAWREGDDFLDWFGAEIDQGRYGSTPASGSPLAWTTNVPGVDGYQELNTYGEDYWMIDFYMDCSSVPDDWFEVKGWLEFAGGYTGWELNIDQQTCTGGEGGYAPTKSTNHKGKCGFINVFTWNEGQCIIDPFPDVGLTTTPATGSTAEPSVERTVVFIEQHTVSGQDVFILGGLQDPLSSTSTCIGSTADTDTCSLPIITRSLGTTSHYEGYNDWRIGDNFLDWHGAEAGQGTHAGMIAAGSPAAWTSNSPSSPGYQELNTFGEAYWMLDFDLDCSLTDGGWFQVKGWLSGEAGEFSGIEDDISQETCSGSAGGSPPYASKSHMARCGHINVFHYDRGDCTISNL